MGVAAVPAVPTHSPYLMGGSPESQPAASITAPPSRPSAAAAASESRADLHGQQQRLPTPLQRMASATIGAILTSLIVTPFDVVKVRMQSSEISAAPRPVDATASASMPATTTASAQTTNGSPLSTATPPSATYGPRCRYYSFDVDVLPRSSLSSASSISATTTHLAHAPPRSVDSAITGTLDGMIKIARAEGAAGLWRGLAPTLVMSIPSTVIYYVGYEYLRDRIGKKVSNTFAEPYAPLFSGALARIASATAISPVELIRTRMQAGDKGAVEITRGVLSLVHQNGIGTLYRGLGPTLWRDVPFSAMYWVGYEYIKDRLIRRNSTGQVMNEFSASFIAGFTSGMVAAVVTHPFDVAKTIQQVAHAESSGAASSASGATKSLNMATVFRGVIEQSGWRGLFVGLTPRVVKVAPACAIMISTYEVGKTLFSSSS